MTFREQITVQADGHKPGNIQAPGRQKIRS